MKIMISLTYSSEKNLITNIKGHSRCQQGDKQQDYYYHLLASDIIEELKL